jgi:hypothetical protein
MRRTRAAPSSCGWATPVDVYKYLSDIGDLAGDLADDEALLFTWRRIALDDNDALTSLRDLLAAMGRPLPS